MARKYLLRLLLVLGGLLFSYVAAETALRIAGFARPETNINQYSEAITLTHPRLPYLYEPNSVFYLQWPSNPNDYFDENNSLKYKTNNAGFRGPDFDKQRNRYVRIAFLGDSLGWGQGVKYEDLVTTRLEAMLQRSDLMDGEFEIYNFSLTGYETRDEVELLRSVALDYKPDVCVIWFFVNDFHSPGDLRDFGYLGGVNILPKARKKSRVLDVVMAPLDNMVTERKLIEAYYKIYAQDYPGFRRGKKALQDFATLCRKENVVPVLAIHPIMGMLDESYPFKHVHEKVKDICEQNDIYCVDMLPFFEGKNARGLWVHPADYHPNHTAHEIAAEGFYQQLLEVIGNNCDQIEKSRSEKQKNLAFKR